jgi:hypothetical protein
VPSSGRGLLERVCLDVVPAMKDGAETQRSEASGTDARRERRNTHAGKCRRVLASPECAPSDDEPTEAHSILLQPAVAI